MRKLSKLVLSAIAAGGVLGAATLVAQAADKPSLKQLVGEGYEIKAVTFIPMDAIKGMGMDPATTVPQILVTLQKKSAMAACQFAAENWAIMAAVSIEGTLQCDVYK
jgi:hypothetical protein